MVTHAAVTGLNIRLFQTDSDVDIDKPIHQMTAQYERFCTASINDTGEARIEGVAFKMTLREAREIFALLSKHGAISVSWRHKNIEHKYDLRTGTAL